MKLYFVKTDGGRCIIALDEIEETAAVCYDGDGCDLSDETYTPDEYLAAALLEDFSDFDTADFTAVYEDICAEDGLEILATLTI